MNVREVLENAMVKNNIEGKLLFGMIAGLMNRNNVFNVP